MGTYYTVQAKYKYGSEAAFVQAVNRLVEGSWLDKDGYWLDELGMRVGSHRGTNKKLLTISMPYNCYRNIGVMLYKLTIQATSFEYTCTCSDGDFSGNYVKSNEYAGGVMKVVRVHYPDLNFFAKEHGMKQVDFNKEKTFERISEIEEAFYNTFWEE